MIHQRIARFLSLTVVVLAMSVLGAGWAGFRTGAGRDLLTRFSVWALSDVLHGTARVDSIGGSVTRGLVIHNLLIHDDDGVLFARLPTVTMRYRLFDLLSRRLVLGQVILDQPHINLFKKPSGRMNYQDVLGLGLGEGNTGPSPLVAFRDAQINGGSTIIRTALDAGAETNGLEIEGEGHHRVRVRRIDSLDASVRYVRIASPFEGENGIELDIRSLRAVMSDPAMDIRGIEGRINIDGRTMTLEVDRLELPGSKTRMYGQMHWPRGKVLLDLDMDAESLAVNDIATFVSRLPWNMTGHGRVGLRSLHDDTIFVTADPLYLQGPNVGGELSGRFEMTVGPGGPVRIDETELQFTNLDLEFVRPLMDTLPFAGRLTGRTVAAGFVDSLDVELDWWFRDSLVAGWPETQLFARGGVALGADGLAFDGLRVDSAVVDLRTVRNMFPAIDLQGEVRGSGVLDRPLFDVVYTGSLLHRDDTLPTTSAQGRIRLNTERDTLGLWAELDFDSLSLAGIRPSYPLVPPSGMLAGTVRIGGYADSLLMDAHMSGPGGRFVSRADMTMLSGTVALYDLWTEVFGLDASQFSQSLLPTELYGVVSGNVIAVDSAPFYTDLRVALDSSFVQGSTIDSLRGGVRVADSVLVTDSVTIYSPSITLMTHGNFGLSESRVGTLMLETTIDSLSWTEPILRHFYPALGNTSVVNNLRGTAFAQLELSGSVGHYGTQLNVQIDEAVTDSALITGFNMRAGWHTALAERANIAATIDSVAWKAQSFSDVELRMDGPRESSQWLARARVGIDASLIGWGKSFVDAQNVILPIDSMKLLLPTHLWDLTPGALIAVSDSGFLFSNFTLQSAGEGSRLALSGRFPINGSATLGGEFVAVPITDVWALSQRDPTSASGLMFGDFVLSGTADLPELESDLNISRLRLGTVQIPEVRGTLAYANRRLIGDYEVRRSGDLAMALDFSLPIDLALRPVPERTIDGLLTVRMRADAVDLAFAELFTPNVRRASGAFDGDFGITGSWDEPRLTGSMQITNGQLTMVPLGITYRDLEGRVTLSTDSILVDRLSASAGTGTLAISGFLRLEDLTRPNLDLRLRAQQFRTINVPDFMTLTTTGDVRLQGPVFGAVLTGNATVTDGVVYFADLVEKRVIDLEDELVASLVDDAFFARAGLRVEEGRQLFRSRFENRFLRSLRIDNATVTMGAQVQLRSSEANIQLTGDVVVSKTLDVYRLDGTLTTPRGTYRMPLGGNVTNVFFREFTVTDGEVRYFGTTDWNAELDIDAQHVVRSMRRDNVTVFVNIGGTLFEPTLTLSSDIQPAVSDTEIISYLLFGAPSIEALAGTQAGQRRQELSRTELLVREVSGVAFGQIEQALIGDLGLPIDIGFRPQGSEAFEATLGWQIHPRLFLSYNPRLCPGQETPARDFFAAGSLEYNVSRSWLFSFNTEPVQRCNLFNSRFSGASNKQQFGVDFFWDKRF